MDSESVRAQLDTVTDNVMEIKKPPRDELGETNEEGEETETNIQNPERTTSMNRTNIYEYGWVPSVLSNETIVERTANYLHIPNSSIHLQKRTPSHLFKESHIYTCIDDIDIHYTYTAIHGNIGYMRSL
jgi:hypothetical protein